MSSLRVVKVLNNNVIIAAHPDYGEVVVIGKGIGFNRKAQDQIPLQAVEKMFILKNEKEKEQYTQLVPQVDEKLIEVMNEVIFFISQHTKMSLNEHIHIALTDHIAFALKRFEQGITIHNPFLLETKELYPHEYELAEHVVRTVNEKMGVDLQEDEIGFVALHIRSATTNRHVSEVKEHSRLISDLVALIEDKLNMKIQRESLNYSRLISHLRFAIERIQRGEKVEEAHKLDELLKREYPEMYSLAWMLVKVMQQRLRKPVYDAETSYLTLHLQRLAQKNEDMGP
ncbi:glucose PTS transporter transcription antiterminator GlcT [Effusibacillus consociatus]|uniref:Glucose PTS transporter transcription antiterminator GlcT n=1 Tax=Effusibacillus consociatus TaxID=1117041 RepID=A0ABV9PWQ5_9BACL